MTTAKDRSGDFFDFGDWVFLNCAYHGPMPRVAARALAAAAELRQNPARLTTEHHFSFPDAYRRAVSALIGCEPETVSLTDSATSGMTLLARGLDWRDGDEIVIPRGEFPANRLPWLALEGRGVRVRQVGLGDRSDPIEAIGAALTGRTRLVSVSWVSFVNGRRIDLARLSELCRSGGALLAVDGSQGVGGLPLDLSQVHVDLLACAGYKWLLGPYGLGFVRIEPELAERLSPVHANWFGVRGAANFNRLADLPLDTLAGPRRFDANETANFLNVAAGTASLRYLRAVTPEAVERHCGELNDRLISGLPSGFKPLHTDSEPRSNILCIAGPDDPTTADACRWLARARVSVSARENFIRVSPHVYNGESDIDRLLEVLAAGESAVRERAPRPGGGVAGGRPTDLDARLRELLGLE